MIKLLRRRPERRGRSTEETELTEEPASGLWPMSAFDVMALVGVCLVSAGAFWIYAPMGLIVFGALMLWFAVWGG